MVPNNEDRLNLNSLFKRLGRRNTGLSNSTEVWTHLIKGRVVMSQRLVRASVYDDTTLSDHSLGRVYQPRFAGRTWASAGSRDRLRPGGCDGAKLLPSPTRPLL